MEEKMSCPKCRSTDVIIVGDHYFCNTCFAEFIQVTDDKKHFPYNIIFPKRPLEEFYRKPYYDIG